MVDGGGIVSAFLSATNFESATLTPTGAGSFTVRLTVTDSTGAAAATNFTVPVAAAATAPPVARIVLSTASPTAGSPVTLGGNTSTVASGTTLKSYTWTLIDGGGIVAAFSAVNTESLSVTPTAAGNFTVQLTVTDSTGAAASNNLTLECSQMPNNSFGFFLTSRTQGLVNQPGGSLGVLCLSGAIGRYVGPGQIKNSGTSGEISLVVNLASHPTPTGPVAVLAGDTWNFQAWFRDVVAGQARSNFSNGLRITFQ